MQPCRRVRFGGCEPHNVAAYIGGVASQEAIKVGFVRVVSCFDRAWGSCCGRRLTGQVVLCVCCHGGVFAHR